MKGPGMGLLAVLSLKMWGGKPGGVRGDGGVEGEHRHGGEVVGILLGRGEHCLDVK